LTPLEALRFFSSVSDTSLVEHNVRSSGGKSREPGLQPLHLFLLRQPAALYALWLGVLLGAIVLAVTFASGAVDVGVPRWLWLLDLLVVTVFGVDHVRFAVSRRTGPRGPVLGAGVLIAGVLVALTLFVCW
jgi:hypothetical protein